MPPGHLSRPRPPSAPERPAAEAGRSGPATAPDGQRCAEQVLEVVPAVMDALRSAMRSHVGEQLSVPQFRCLNFISRKPGTSVGAVAHFLGVTMPTASAMVDRLVRAGAVQHDADPADRRRLRLVLTPFGQDQLQGIEHGAREDLARALARQPVQDLIALQRGLDVLRRTFDTAAEPVPAGPRPSFKPALPKSARPRPAPP